jgi:thiopurine S-methyltransferase
MQANFWLDKWHRNEIGFHKSEFNSNLTQNFSRLNLAKGSHVFVPLAGKSLDILWLLQQGFKVSAIELSPLAIHSFFEENKISFNTERCGNMTKYCAKNLSFFQGDFFELKECDLSKIDAIYDRAASVALPLEMRKRYHQKLATLLGHGSKTLLVALEYEQEKFQGPPFSIPDEEIRSSFKDEFEVLLLSDEIVENSPPRFKELSMELREKVYVLTKK